MSEEYNHVCEADIVSAWLAMQERRYPDLLQTAWYPLLICFSTEPARATALCCPGVTELSYTNMGQVVAAEVSKLLSGQPPTIQLNKIAQRQSIQTQSIGL